MPPTSARIVFKRIAKLTACPTCGGVRNVTNKQCAKCYMREYRKRKKAA